MTTDDFRPQKLLCVVAHADDIEFCIGGSIAKWVPEGTEVHYLICSNGANGTQDRQALPDDVIAKRRQEQQAAAEVLGVSSIQHLDYPDSFVAVDDSLRGDIVKVIRNLQPDTVFCMDPTFYYSVKHNYINHRDHRAVGQATMDAVYPLARDHSSFPEQLTDGLDTHKVRTLLLCNLESSNFFVDISDTFDKKMEALYAHASQMPKSEPEVREFFHKIAARCGQDCDCQLAEGFIKLDTFS